jgi:hypothetical protein
MSDEKIVEGEILEEELPHGIKITASIAKLIAGYGTGLIVSQIVQNNVAPKNVIQKGAIVVGAMAVGGLAAHHAGNYMREYVGELYTLVRQVNSKVTEVQAEIKKVKEQNGL